MSNIGSCALSQILFVEYIIFQCLSIGKLENFVLARLNLVGPIRECFRRGIGQHLPSLLVLRSMHG
jgi:hypothetical protein